MTRVEAKFWLHQDGGRLKPPKFPYACTTLIDNIARSIRIHHDGDVLQGIPFMADIEFIYEPSIAVVPGQMLRFYEGPHEVGVGRVYAHDIHCDAQSQT